MYMRKCVRFLTKLSVLAGTVFVGQALAQKATDTEGRLVSIPDYQISAAAEVARLDGKIIILVKIDKKGEVKHAAAVAGPMWPCGSEPSKEIAEVVEQAERTARTAKFSPALKDGKPVESELLLTMPIGRAYRNSLRKRDPDNPKEPGVPSPKIISGGVLNGKALLLARPEYPESAREKKIHGQVTIEILIDEKGSVMSAGAVGGPPQLQMASRTAACSSRYSPTTLEGHPVKVSGVIIYNFTK